MTNGNIFENPDIIKTKNATRNVQNMSMNGLPTDNKGNNYNELK